MKNKLLIFGMLVMVLTLGLALAGCATTGTVGDNNGDDVIGGLVWKKEHFYSTGANPWTNDDNHSLTLVFTETQLSFRYDSNGDGDFEDAGEYTYTYTITGFGGNDWSGGDNGGGNYEREITVNNEIKTGSGINTDLTGRAGFVVTPNLGGNGKIDGKIGVHAGTDAQNGKDLGFWYKGR